MSLASSESPAPIAASRRDRCGSQSGHARTASNQHHAGSPRGWPGHTEADLFAVNKVLNEPDFAQLMVVHDLMIAMKLGRHYKGSFS